MLLDSIARIGCKTDILLSIPFTDENIYPIEFFQSCATGHIGKLADRFDFLAREYRCIEHDLIAGNESSFHID